MNFFISFVLKKCFLFVVSILEVSFHNKQRATWRYLTTTKNLKLTHYFFKCINLTYAIVRSIDLYWIKMVLKVPPKWIHNMKVLNSSAHELIQRKIFWYKKGLMIDVVPTHTNCFNVRILSLKLYAFLISTQYKCHQICYVKMFNKFGVRFAILKC